MTPTQKRILFKKFHWSDNLRKWYATRLTAVEKLYIIKIAKNHFQPSDSEITDWNIQSLVEAKKNGDGDSRGYIYLDHHFNPGIILKEF